MSPGVYSSGADTGEFKRLRIEVGLHRNARPYEGSVSQLRLLRSLGATLCINRLGKLRLLQR
jgi:hypothetical protein